MGQAAFLETFAGVLGGIFASERSS